MRLEFLTLLFLPVFLMPAQCFAEDVIVTLKASVVLQGIPQQDIAQKNGQVVLSDIATIQAADTSLMTKLKKLALGHAPRPGVKKTVTRATISNGIARLTGLQPVSIGFLGAEHCVVSRAASDLDLAAFVDRTALKLTEWIKTQYRSLEPLDIRVDSVVSPGDMVLAIPDATEVRVEVRLDKHAAVRNRMRAWLDIYTGNSHFQTLPLWYAVSVFGNVVVSQVDIPNRGELTQNNVRLEYADITGLTSPMSALTGGERLRVIRALRAGDVIDLANTESAPLIAAGENVDVYVTHGAVAVVDQGLAREDGWAQQPILLENPRSKKTYFATVTGPGVASVY